MTYSWKEGAVRRKEMQIGQVDARPVTGANKKRGPKKKDKPWAVVVTYSWTASSGLSPTHTSYFLHEEDARKFARKQATPTTTTQVLYQGEPA